MGKASECMPRTLKQHYADVSQTLQFASTEVRVPILILHLFHLTANQSIKYLYDSEKLESFSI